MVVHAAQHPCWREEVTQALCLAPPFRTSRMPQHPIADEAATANTFPPRRDRCVAVETSTPSPVVYCSHQLRPPSSVRRAVLAVLAVRLFPPADVRSGLRLGTECWPRATKESDVQGEKN